jgi:mono/diheme cytochrome c family protein
MDNIVAAIALVNVIGAIVLWTRNKSALYSLFGVSILALFIITTYRDITPEWKDYQRQYLKLMMEKETDPVRRHDLARFDIKMRQIWNRELGVADRCTSCHMGVDNSLMKGAPQPFRYHPEARVLESGKVVHDFNKIGCVICHGGQGLATNKTEAHAMSISHWETPMLPVGKMGMTQASCSQCHEELRQKGADLEGGEMLLDAINFANGDNSFKLECVSCHTIQGVGEVVAPDLSNFGESTQHEFEGTHNMKYVEGEKNKYEWTFQHFLNPKKISPADPAHGVEETIMPNFEMDKETAHKLVVWMYSMKESNIPVKYRYRPKEVDKRRGKLQEEIAGLYTPEEYAALSDGEKIFLKYNCWVCHSVRGKGGKLAPDLTNVGTRRKEDWMLKHFTDPRSVSQKTFMPKFNLSEQQMEELVVFLKSITAAPPAEGKK